MGHARKCIIDTAADALIVIGGGAGTLSELATAWIGGPAAAIVVLEGLDGRAPLDTVVVGAGRADKAMGVMLGELEQARLWMPELIKRAA